MAILFSVSIASAKKVPAFVGNWMSEKIITPEGSKEIFMPLTFEADRDILFGDMLYGVWTYDKKNKIIHFNSFLKRNMTGDWKILTITKEKFVISKEEMELHFFKYDTTAIKNVNSKAGLVGLWKLEVDPSSIVEDIKENAEEEVAEEASEEGNNNSSEEYEEYEEPESSKYLRFEDNLSFSLIEEYENGSSSNSGSWIFNPKEKSIIFITLRSILIGKSIISEQTSERFLIENRNQKYIATKIVEQNLYEELNFTYNDLNNNQEEELSLPWSSIELLIQGAENTKALVYQKGIYKKKLKIFEFHDFIIKPKSNSEQYSVTYSSFDITKTDTIELEPQTINEESENGFIPFYSLDIYKVIGKEEITTAAGTFQCTVVVGFDDDDGKFKYWMIGIKPGVFAKIISVKKVSYSRSEYTLFLLKEIQI